MKIFVVIKGNNGATYVFNTKNWKSISHSLKFYQARTLKAKFLKLGLQYYLLLKSRLFYTKLKSVIEMNLYLKKVSETNTTFNIDDNSSILISPTYDKVIVHHHDEHFQKFAFGKSYEKVKKEAAIYALFSTDKKHFQTSEFYDVEDQKNQLISFKLSNKHISTAKATQISENLVPALLEFFKSTNQNNISIKDYVSGLQNQLQQIEAIVTEAQQKVLATIKTNYGALEFPLGLVHRDFKPWNMIAFQKPLIFDFEEAVADGPPLEDLLNFYIDPIIRYKTTEEVLEMALSKEHLGIYSSYLKALHIEISLKVFLHFYLIARMLFWSQTPELETATCYKKLSDSLIAQKMFS